MRRRKSASVRESSSLHCEQFHKSFAYGNGRSLNQNNAVHKSATVVESSFLTTTTSRKVHEHTNLSITKYRRLIALLLVFLGLSLTAHILLLFHSYRPNGIQMITSAITNTLFCVNELPLAVRRLAKCSRLKGSFLGQVGSEIAFPAPAYFLYEPPPLLLTNIDENDTDIENNEKDFLPKILRTLPDTSRWRDVEARSALHAARRLRQRGSLRRARTVIEHAYSLSPNHPDILTEYGLFIELTQKDVVVADGFYRKALVRDPTHSEALIRRDRTLPMVEEIDGRVLAQIHQKRDMFLKIPRTDSGLRRAMRESYFAHVYHTVAMEGNTFSLAQTRSVLETRVAVAGKSIIEHNEILGMDAALRYLNQTLTDLAEITVDDILSIHKRVLGFVDPMAAGVIRRTQVYVGTFTPPSPEKIFAEMEELVDWLNDEETYKLDPIKIAALAHYKLVYIHPFIDGNGRTSRLLMNFILMRAGFPPVTIPVEHRQRYYHALQEANSGDLRPFIRFIAEQTDRALEGFLSSTTFTTASDDEKCGATDQNKITLETD